MNARGHSKYQTLALAGMVLVLMATAAAALALLRPAPGRTLVMATATPGSGYHQLGERYRDLLAREGVDLRILETGGDVDNLERLRDPDSGVSVAFLQGGLTNERDSPNLESLGTVFYDPLWFFCRGDPPETTADMFREKRVSIGPEGSGTRKLALELIAAVGVGVTEAQWLGLSPEHASEALLRGEVDVVALVAPWESAPMRRMLSSPDVNAWSLHRADAHVAQRPYLSKLVLPEGVADLEVDRPPVDLVLVAPKTSLVVRDDLHPALQYLLLEAAAQVHGGPGVFRKAGQFPAAEPIDLPLSKYARNYYRTGVPFLQRYLPFWLAVLVSRLFVLLIPVLGMAYPLLRVAPQIYGWSMRRRIYVLYGELKFLEAELLARAEGEPVDDLVAGVERLEERARHVVVPRAFTHMLYSLRNHIGPVRERLEKRMGSVRQG